MPLGLSYHIPKNHKGTIEFLIKESYFAKLNVYYLFVLPSLFLSIFAIISFFFFFFAKFFAIISTNTYECADWQSVICSLEDVNAIKPGKVSSICNYIFYCCTCMKLFFTINYDMQNHLVCSITSLNQFSCGMNIKGSA